jgi:hypothetical protein
MEAVWNEEAMMAEIAIMVASFVGMLESTCVLHAKLYSLVRITPFDV